MSIIVNTQKRNQGAFRYGQDFTIDNVDYSINREGYAYWLVEKCIQEAMKNNFDIIDKNQKIVRDNDKILAKFKKVKPDVHMCIKFERAHGKALAFAERNKANELIIHAFNVRKYNITYDKEYEITKVVATEEILGLDKTIEHTITGKNLEHVYELIIRPTEKKGQGKSILEPVWDTLYGLNTLDRNAVYFAIRVGGGLKVVYVTEAQYRDETFMSQLRKDTAEINSGNGVLVFPVVDLVENSKNLGMEFLSGEQIDFLTLRDMLLGTLSVATGISKEAWLRESDGDKFVDKLEYYKDLQETYDDFLRWVIEEIVKTYNFKLPDEYQLRYKVREQLTEETRLNVLQQKVNIAQRMGYAIDKEQMESLIGLKLEETEEVNPQEEDKNFVEQKMDKNSNNSSLAQEHAKQKMEGNRP